MINYKIVIIFFVLFFQGPISSAESSRISHALSTGRIETAIDLYNEQKEISGRHDLELIQKLGFALLQQGRYSQDPEVQILTLFGSGISGSDEAIPILEWGIQSNEPALQSLAINFLAKFQNDRATEILNQAMSSNSLLIRLESAYYLAKNKSPKAPGQVEALLQKSPPEALPIFPQILSCCGDKNSIRQLRRLLSNPNPQCRIEAILAVAKSGRDDLLPEIRRLATHLNKGQQEAAAFALGVFKDESSVSRLIEISKSPDPHVRLAGLSALFNLGRDEAKNGIENLALSNDLFAISLLGNIEGSERVLKRLLRSNDINVRLNAALSLLKHHNGESLRGLNEVFIKDKRDLAFSVQATAGKTLTAWRVIPSARQNSVSNPVSLEISLNLRENTLAETLSLPEEDFLSLTEAIFESGQMELVPTLTMLLANLHSEEAIRILKVRSTQVGSPLVRNYCNLALYKSKEPGPYQKDLETWIRAHLEHNLMQFRPIIPWEQRIQGDTFHQMTPEDDSRLLVESLEAMIQAQDEKAIDILIEAIRHGNKKNRYALAGLLMRAAA